MEVFSSQLATPEQLASMLQIAAHHVQQHEPRFDVQEVIDSDQFQELAPGVINDRDSDSDSDNNSDNNSDCTSDSHSRHDDDYALRTPTDDGSVPSTVPENLKPQLNSRQLTLLRGMFASLLDAPEQGVGTGVAVLKDGELLAQRLRAAIRIPLPDGSTVPLRSMTWDDLTSDSLGAAAAYGDLATCTTRTDDTVRRARELLAPNYKPEKENVPRIASMDGVAPLLALAKEAIVESLFPNLRDEVQLVPHKLNRYMGQDHFAWHVDTPRPQTLASLVVCLGYAKAPLDSSTDVTTWVTREDALGLGCLELLPLAQRQDEEKREDEEDEEDADRCLSHMQRCCKRRALLPTGAAVRTDPDLGTLLRMGMGAVAFYRNVRHRVTPCQHNTPVARWSMTFALERVMSEGDVDAPPPLPSPAAVLTCAALRSRPGPPPQEATGLRCARILGHMARFVLGSGTTLGLLYANDYSAYELQSRVVKIGDAALARFAAFMQQRGIPFHRALQFTAEQEIRVPVGSGGGPSLSRIQYKVKGTGAFSAKRLHQLHACGDSLSTLACAAMNEAARAVAAGFAPLHALQRGQRGKKGSRLGPVEPCTVAFLHPPSAWNTECRFQHLNSGAEFTGNESEDGEMRATYGTCGLFLPSSPQLLAWYKQQYPDTPACFQQHVETLTREIVG